MMFRFKALQKMREPDELDSPSLLAAPRGWIAVFVIMFVMCGAGVWAFLGTIPISVNAPGLLTYLHGTTSVQTPMDGTVTEVLVHPGDRVELGEPLAALTTTAGVTEQIPSPFNGQVVGLSVTEAQIVDRGDSVLTIERFTDTTEPMVAMLFVSEKDAQGLRTGLGVQLSVSNAPAAAFGLLKGKVSSISPFPLTSPQISALVGGDLAAKAYATTSAPHLVIVELVTSPRTVSGYAWSTADGPPLKLHSQVSVTATVMIASQSPISLVFGR